MAAYVGGSIWRGEFDALFCDLVNDWKLTEVDNLPSIDEDRKHGWKRCQRKGDVRFECKICHKKWSSLNGVVIFHYRFVSAHGEVKKSLLGQKCEKCSGGKFEEAEWSSSEISKVLSSLLEKVKEKYYCKSGVNTSGDRHQRKMNGPHLSDLCEACQKGICSENKVSFLQDYDDDDDNDDNYDYGDFRDYSDYGEDVSDNDSLNAF